MKGAAGGTSSLHQIEGFFGFDFITGGCGWSYELFVDVLFPLRRNVAALFWSLIPTQGGINTVCSL